MAADAPAGGPLWRAIGTLETDLREERKARHSGDEKLDETKADAKDVAALAKEFGSLRRTLQWFMGLVVLAMLTFAGIVVQLLGAH